MLYGNSNADFQLDFKIILSFDKRLFRACFKKNNYVTPALSQKNNSYVTRKNK